MSNALSRHKEAFLLEAREHIAGMNTSLLRLEKSPADKNSLHEILRAAHTLKSMAAAMNYPHTADLCHAIEDVVSAIQQGATELERCTDVLFESFDLLSGTLVSLNNDEPENSAGGVIARLRGSVEHSGGSAEKMDIQHEDLPALPVAEPIHTIAVSVDKLDALLNLTEELLVARMRLGRIKEKQNNPELSAAVESVGRLIADLQYNVMQARMVPIGFVFDRFPRMVRDLARIQSKEVNLALQGGDIALDRAMIEELGECLVHLLRNAVDHGVELPNHRLQVGKLRSGTIKLTASRNKQSALITVEDDGAGIDVDAVLQAARRRGILTADATSDQIIHAIFHNVSTSTRVTTVSGRGVGLNIAKRKTEAIGGAITVESRPGQGTKFTIGIPLTMAVIKTLFVAVGGRTYAIPVANIERLVTANDADVKMALGQEAIVLEKEEVPIKRLDALFHHPLTRLTRQPIVIVQKGRGRVGLAVDSLMSTEEVVIKPLNGVLRENRYFAGSALIGSGEIVMVLEVGHLMNSVRRNKEIANREEGVVLPEGAAESLHPGRRKAKACRNPR